MAESSGTPCALGQRGIAFCQHRAEALAAGGQLDQAEDHLGIAIAYFQPACICSAEQTALEQLAGQADGHAQADDVHAVQVAQVPGVDHGFQVEDHQQRAECPHRLVLGSIHFGVVISGRLRFPPAGDHTFMAGGIAGEVLVSQVHAREIVSRRVFTQLEISDRQVAQHVAQVHVTRGTVGSQRLRGEIIFIKRQDLVGNGLVFVGCIQGYPARASRRDRLEVL